MIARELLQDRLLCLANALRDSMRDEDGPVEREARQMAAAAIDAAREWQAAVARHRVGEGSPDDVKASWPPERLVAVARELLEENATLRALDAVRRGDAAIPGTEQQDYIVALESELSRTKLDLQMTKQQRDDFANALRRERMQRETLERLGNDRDWNDPTKQRGEGAIPIIPGDAQQYDAVLDYLEEHVGEPLPAFGTGVFDGTVFETPGRRVLRPDSEAPALPSAEPKETE